MERRIVIQESTRRSPPGDPTRSIHTESSAFFHSLLTL
jgi:hypothetical protein